LFEDFRLHYLEQPQEVALETLAVCNARCTFCPYPTLERIGEKMPDELIERLIMEMATFKVPFFFSPQKVNEPLLDKRLIPILQMVNRECRQARLRIFTNGSPLNQEHIEDIAGLERVYHLWVSLNETDPAKYEALMGLPFERTARNLDRLHAANFPHAVVLSTVGHPNDEFIDYCVKRWPKFQPFVIRRTGWLGEIEPQDAPIPDTPCTRWFEMSICATGVASLCCMASDAKWSIGNVNTQTLSEIYNSPPLRERREKLFSRKLVSPCAGCNY
jgi:MoaA/NifB/PqqE/SkfB family radical SAM enzyme